MYNVRYWDEDKIHSSHEDLKEAKRICRNLGHTEKLLPNGNYPPVAFVSLVESDGFEGVIYNPRFKNKGKSESAKKLGRI